MSLLSIIAGRNRVSTPTIPVPVNIDPPVISPSSGLEGSTIDIVSTGSWDPAPDEFSFSWLLNGFPIVGETGAAYVAGPASPGDVVTANVFARMTGGGWSGPASSNSFTYDDAGGLDPDALDWILRVESEDGGTLDESIQGAMNELVLSLKAAAAPLGGTNWDAVVDGCLLIFAGPVTLAGILEPVSAAMGYPTNTNLVSGDYNRKLGLTGSASGKYITLPDLTGGPTIDDHAMAAWVENLGTAATARTMLVSGTGAGTTGIRKSGTPGTATINSANTISADTTGISESTYGFYGLSRTNSANFVSRVAGASATRTRVSASFSPDLCRVFLRSDNIQGFTGRLKAAFFGKSVDLEALEASLTAYFNAIDAAIP